jgi:hypothetical protein
VPPSPFSHGRSKLAWLRERGLVFTRSQGERNEFHHLSATRKGFQPACIEEIGA